MKLTRRSFWNRAATLTVGASRIAQLRLGRAVRWRRLHAGRNPGRNLAPVRDERRCQGVPSRRGESPPGIRARNGGQLLGIQRRHPRSNDRGCRRRPRFGFWSPIDFPSTPPSTGTAFSCLAAWTAPGGLTQPHIKPGETYVYELTLRQHGTFMYHPHADETVQMAMGLMGFFVIHPKRRPQPIDRDFAIFLSEWHVPPGSYTPDPNVMTDFNAFTFKRQSLSGHVASRDPQRPADEDSFREREHGFPSHSHPRS